MPVKNGIQAVQEIKAMFRQRNSEEMGVILLIEPEFVILTAFRTPNFEKHLKQQGISECFEKPIDRD
jgi:hypothetical protein